MVIHPVFVRLPTGAQACFSHQNLASTYLALALNRLRRGNILTVGMKSAFDFLITLENVTEGG